MSLKDEKEFGRAILGSPDIVNFEPPWSSDSCDSTGFRSLVQSEPLNKRRSAFLL